jgi:hypothetical protein
MEEKSQIPTLWSLKQETISKPKIIGQTHQTHSCVFGLHRDFAQAIT